MGIFWKIVNKVIRDADIILEVLDSRFIDESRNKEIEDKIERNGKVLIHVINKCDLVDPKYLNKKKNSLTNCVFVSSTVHHGFTKLREKILIVGKRAFGKDEFIVGVVGYPNTGKSSVINALSGRRKAPTSSRSGFTKGVMKVKADNKIRLLDTPGVLPFDETDELRLVLLGSKNFDQIKNPDYIAESLIENNKDLIKSYYDVPEATGEEMLESIALKFNFVKKGNTPDIERTARHIMRDWQVGKLWKS